MVDTAAPRSRSSSILPLAGICCLLTLGFLIATTIVLALIPIYLPSKQATLAVADPNDPNDVFYAKYTSDGDPATSQSGSLDNIDEINQALGLDDVDVTEGFIRAVNDRRRRSLVSRRQKRSTNQECIFKCKHKKKPSCGTDVCKKKRDDDTDKKFKKRGNLNNLPCSRRTAGKVTRIRVSFTLVGVIVSDFAQALLGFGAVNSLTITAVRSGFAQDPSTWLFGILPFAGCSIVIPVGITVTWARPALIFPLVKIQIFGIIAFGTGQSSFTCNFPLNLDIRAGGRMRIEASSKVLILQEGSIIITRTGGFCGPVGVIVRSRSSSGAESSITIDKEEGPLTCAVSPGIGLIFQKRIVFIVRVDGDITSPSCFLNGEIPSVDACDGGCGMIVAPGVKFSLAGLTGGIMTFFIAEFLVLGGAILEFGSAGLVCRFPIQLNMYGKFTGPPGRILIRIPGGNGDMSAINIFPGGSVDILITLVIQVYNRFTGLDIGPPFEIPGGSFGPLFIFTTADGSLEISIIGPGGAPTTAAPLTTPAIG